MIIYLNVDNFFSVKELM